jgi:hypothetical protein
LPCKIIDPRARIGRGCLPAARRDFDAAERLDPLRVSPAGFHRPLAARVERKLNMSCLYSSACVYVLTALNLAVYAIPLVIVAYLFIKRIIEAPRAATRAWVPLLFFFAVILLLHGVSELIGPDGWVGLIYILAGAYR